MTEAELREKYDLVKEQLFSGAVKSSVYRTFFSQAKPVECNGKWYVAPVRFTDKEWAKKNYISDLVRRMNDKLDRPGFSLQREVKVFQAKPFCYLVIGRAEITRFNNCRSQQKINVKLGSAERYETPAFKRGELIDLKINSQQRGWLYLFCIDSEGVTTPVYPNKFGLTSDIKVSVNHDFPYSKFANERRTKAGLGGWRFAGTTSGPERVFALTIDSVHPKAIDEEFLLKNYSFSLLFAHRKVSKGLDQIPDQPPVNIEEFENLDIAIGFADYYYEANAPS